MQDMDLNKEEDELTSGQVLRKLTAYLWPPDQPSFKIRVAVAFFFLIVAKLLLVYGPFLYKEMVDVFDVKNKTVALPLLLLLSYCLARVGGAFFGELRDIVFEKVAQGVKRSIALATFNHIHKLSLRFHLERKTGGLSRIIERGTRGMQFVLDFMVFNIIPTIFEILLISVILIHHFDYRYALIIVISVVLYTLFTFSITEWRLRLRRKMNKSDTEANTKAVDSLLNYETVKYFNNEEHESKRYDESLKVFESAAIKSQNTLTVLNMGQTIIIAIGLFFLLWLSASEVVSGKYTLGDFVLLNTYLIQLFLPLNFLGFVYREMKQGFTDMDKMFTLLDVEQEVKDDPDAKDLQVNKGEINFHIKEFCYDGDKQKRIILKDIFFKAPARKITAIVGHTGSGKSTLLRLLYRFYDLENHSSIEIDSQALNKVTQKSLRQAIGIVPQDTVLFNDTIYYNIHYGNLNATAEQVSLAAKAAQIDDFIENTLPQKYETVVGERGLKLSGGEKQRVAIARTILKNPPILLFDEATSALDSATEREIQRSLKEISRNRTTIVIAHRLSTIQHADNIIVMEKGRIKEQGNHASLMKKKGLYFSLWQKQSQHKSKKSD